MNRLILYLSALILLFGADSLVARNRPLNIGSYNIRCTTPATAKMRGRTVRNGLKR